MWIRSWWAALAVFGAGFALAEPDPAPIPAKAFYRLADVAQTRLSPSGRWLAVTAPIGGSRIGLTVLDVQNWGQGKPVAGFQDADIRNVWWVNDDRLVFTLIDHTRGGGEQKLGTGLYSVRPDGSDLRQLIKTQWDPGIGIRPEPTRERLPPSHALLFVPGDGGDDVVVGEYRFDNTGEFTDVVVKRLNVVTGRATLQAGAPQWASDWTFDRHGKPRAVVTEHKGREAIYWMAADGDHWQQLAEYEIHKAPFSPEFVDDEGHLYVTENSGPGKTAVLKRFDFAKGRPDDKPVADTPGFDFDGGFVTEGGKKLGLRIETDAQTTVWFDARMAELQKEANRRLPGHVNHIECSRCGTPDMVAAIFSWSDRDPGQLWLYREQKKEWQPALNYRPDIDPNRMGVTDFERIRARDGREFPLWITYPPGSRQAARPAVVLVHGGPWVRGGHWRWEQDRQFLASRGYVVIEPEFRGSMGFGADLYHAGWREWGRTMQDDVADALLWAEKKGVADPKRACIAGASYGGYATLMGLVRHPDLYRCGVAWVAVSDPRLMFKWSVASDLGEESRVYSLPALIGDPVADADRLAEVAPVLHADRIKAPVFLAFGAEDRRVPIEHGELMRDALKKAGNPPEWVVYPGEGHGWLTLEHKVDFAERMERFLAKNLN